MNARRVVTALLLGALTVTLSAGAEGCRETGKGGTVDDGTGAQPEPQRIPVPRPNPDHGPAQPATPGPVAGDPNPHVDERNWIIFWAWSPANEFVDIEWNVGASGERSRERRGGTYSRSGVGRKGDRYSIDAEWTEISYGRLDSAATIKIVLVVGGKEQCERETEFRPGKPPGRGTDCTGFLK